MQGRRIETQANPVAGDYYKHRDGRWHGVCPNGLHCNLSNHIVTVNPDGTITVAPSILCSLTGTFDSDKAKCWHGYLRNGVWEEC